MPEISQIGSNLKRVSKDYDEELPTPAAAPLPYADSTSAQTEDAEAERFEENYRGAEARRWRGQERWMGRENEEARLVNFLSPYTVFRKLQLAGVDARTEAPEFYVMDVDHRTGKPVTVRRERTSGRLWLHTDSVVGLIGVSAWVVKDGQRVREMVTTLQYPAGPEWSLMWFDQFDVPIKERWRGWRTAMLELIRKGVLTEEEVNRAFGPPAICYTSLFYREELYKIRMQQRGLTQ